jgi:shikimate dehydrogenase
LKSYKLGIIGWPLGYSLSPLMHSYAIQASGLNGEYKEYKVEPAALEGWLQREALTLHGFNVTMPHKARVWEWICEDPARGDLVGEALILGAVNTVLIKGERMLGYNTDGLGFLSAFHSPLDLKGWRVVLLGSGGAAAAVAFALLESGISHLTIWNRQEHLERAELLAARLNAIRGLADFAQAVSDVEALPVTECQLLVNATPMGMKRHEQVPDAILKKIHGVQTVYDIVYEPRETGLIAAARKAGAKAITGDVMLAGQGAAAFEIFTGTRWMQPVMQQALDEHFRNR